ncbi:MAG: 4Fe-4S dicluster domain-containing protein [Candidatus Omnitrophica bacterium]|nr:4Fe-4S dicluster domain-containing protein [Candidatus Omnitrophota bacterium]
MAKIVINREKCKGCLLCISFCPKGLIGLDKDLNRRGIKPVKFSRQANLNKGGTPPKAEKETSDCIGCSMCAIICPDCCIEVYK